MNCRVIYSRSENVWAFDQRRDNKGELSALWCEQIVKTCIYAVFMLNRCVYIGLVFNLLSSTLLFPETVRLILFRQRNTLNQNNYKRSYLKKIKKRPCFEFYVASNNPNPHQETFGKAWWWPSVMANTPLGLPSQLLLPPVCHASKQYLAWSPSSTHKNMEAIIAHHCEEDLDFKSWRAVSHGKHTYQLTGCHTTTLMPVYKVLLYECDAESFEKDN